MFVTAQASTRLPPSEKPIEGTSASYAAGRKYQVSVRNGPTMNALWVGRSRPLGV